MPTATATKLAPTPAPVLNAINAMVDSCANRVAYLASRWLDESAHEDFADYTAELRKVLPKGFTFVKATKRPFGFHFRADAFPGALYAVYITTRAGGWKRIG